MLRHLLLSAALVAVALPPRPALGQEPAPSVSLATLPIDSLFARMSAEDAERTRAAFEEIVRRASPAEVAPFLRRENPLQRSAALDALFQQGALAVPTLLAELRRDEILLFFVGRGGDGDPRNRPLAAALLEDETPALRVAGARLLGRPWYGKAETTVSPEAERLMLAALADADGEVRFAAVVALDQPRAVTEREVQALVSLLRTDPDAEVRASVALTLPTLPAEREPFVAPLIAALATDDDSEVRLRSAQALGELGPIAAPAVPALMRATRARQRNVRIGALAALGEIGLGAAVDAEAVLQTLRDALGNLDPVVRRAAVNAAELLGPPARPLVLDALRDPAGEVAASAAGVLADGPATPPTVDALFAALADARDTVRHAAADALVSLGPEQLPRLRETAEGGTEAARDAALRAVHLLREATRLPLAGACYAIRRGPWTPRMELDLDSIYSTPPQQVRFTTRVRRGFRSPRFDVERADPTEHGWTLGSWHPVAGQDSISVDFTNGFSGVMMNLALRPDGSLYGSAQAYWDFPRDRQQAEITAERIPCPRGREGA